MSLLKRRPSSMVLAAAMTRAVLPSSHCMVLSSWTHSVPAARSISPRNASIDPSKSANSPRNKRRTWTSGFVSSSVAPSARKISHLRAFASSSGEASLPVLSGDRNGLIRHEVIADDGHRLRLYSRAPRDKGGSLLRPDSQRSVLLLHGRTWSSQPVFDLRTSPDDEKQQSTLQSLSDLGFAAYALDLRGFGETPRDAGGYTTPMRCVRDVQAAIHWIRSLHGDQCDTADARPALLGWSQGALVAQIYAQMHGSHTLSDLVLFGSIYDPKVIYHRKPLYDPKGNLLADAPAPQIKNTDVASLEDFTLPGTICDEAAMTFSSLALEVDPIKAAWDELHEFNACNPALVRVPTMVIVGSQDPYVSWDAQRELFDRLGVDDKVFCILPGCDHAAHILKERRMFVRALVGFLLRKEGF